MECLNCGSEVKQHLMPFCDEDCETDYWCRVEDGAYLESIGNDEDVPL